MSWFDKLFRRLDTLKLTKDGNEIDFETLFEVIKEYKDSGFVSRLEYNNIKQLLNDKVEENEELKEEVKMLLAELSKYQNGGGGIQEPNPPQEPTNLIINGTFDDDSELIYNPSQFTVNNGAIDFVGGIFANLEFNLSSNLELNTEYTFNVDVSNGTTNRFRIFLRLSDNSLHTVVSNVTYPNGTVEVVFTTPDTLQATNFIITTNSLASSFTLDNATLTTEAIIVDNEAPTTPTNLVGSNITSNSVTLNWDASTDNIGVTGYDIYRNTIKITTSATNSFTVTGLSPETSYDFYVKAKDAAGNESTQSNSITITTSASTPEPEGVFAFPSAYGAGADATGGRGATVLHVTNLNWDENDTGSLKYAITRPFPRTIVFDVSGEIDATSEGAFAVLINGSSYDNMTIAGQTAPEGGITIKTSYFMFQDVDNVIVRYIRFRNIGTPIVVGQSTFLPDTFSYLGGTSIVFDHCTFSHGQDEAGSWANSSATMGNVTIQNCFFQDSKTGSILGVDEVEGDFTFRNNVYSGISHRFPNPKGNGQYDIYNNVVYNWRSRLVRITYEGHYNIVNNYYKPSNGGLRSAGWFGSGTIPINNLQKLQAQPQYSPLIHTRGNIITGQRETPQADDSDMWAYFAGSDASFPENDPVDARFFTASNFAIKGRLFGINTATQAYNSLVVSGDVGAYKYLDNNGDVATYRDTKDTLDLTMIVNDSYAGSFYDSVSSIPFPTVPENTRPVNFYDSNPHIPEAWLTANGITGSANIHNEVQVSGYTLLEEYINQVDN